MADIPRPDGVATEVAQEKAETLELCFFETSAKDATNVNAVFDYLISIMMGDCSSPGHVIQLGSPYPPQEGKWCGT